MAPDFTNRAIALLALAPPLGLRFVKQTDRFASVFADGDTVTLILQITLGQDREVRQFTLSGAREGGAVSLSHCLLHTPSLVSTDVSAKDQRYLSALLSWAETALPGGKIRKRPAAPKADFASLRALIDLIIAGDSAAVRDRIFDDVAGPVANQDAVPSIDLARQLCTALRDHGWLSQIDWNDDEGGEALNNLHRRRGVEEDFVWTLTDEGDDEEEDGVAEMLIAYAAWLRPRGLTLLIPDSEMDSYFALVVPRPLSAKVTKIFGKMGLGVSQSPY